MNSDQLIYFYLEKLLRHWQGSTVSIEDPQYNLPSEIMAEVVASFTTEGFCVSRESEIPLITRSSLKFCSVPEWFTDNVQNFRAGQGRPISEPESVKPQPSPLSTCKPERSGDV